MKTKKRIFSAVFAMLAALTIAFIWCNSSRAGVQSEGMSLGVMQSINTWLQRIGIDAVVSNHVVVRKMGHIAEFALLGMLLALSFQAGVKKRKRWLFLPFVTGLAVAAVDESIQLHVPGRAGKISDVGIDSVGLIIGIALGALILWLINRIAYKRKKQSGEE